MTRDPLDIHEALRAAVFDDDDLDSEDEFVCCDWCNRRATTTSIPGGWPLCEECAEEQDAEHRAIDRAKHGRSLW